MMVWGKKKGEVKFGINDRQRRRKKTLSPPIARRVFCVRLYLPTPSSSRGVHQRVVVLPCTGGEPV